MDWLQKTTATGWVNLTAALILVSSAALAGPRDQPPTRSNTAIQEGREAYLVRCASCHGAGLGGGLGPALSGAEFSKKWSGSRRGALLDFIRAKMPPNQTNTLGAQSYAAIDRYIRESNDIRDAASVPAAASTGKEPTPPTENGEYVPPAGETVLDGTYREARQRLVSLASHLTPVTEALQREPASGDWLIWRRTLGSSGFSDLHQINTQNVSRLSLAWSLSLRPGTNGVAPLVHDGVLFINNSGAVQAMAADSGELIWEYVRPATTTRVPISQPRGIALYGNAVYVPTIDTHMLALDAATGKLLWDHEIAAPSDRLEITGGPVAVHGKILQGVAGCQGAEYQGGCFIVALDAADGREIWRFHTIARPGEPGGDSWNGASIEQRFGSSVWAAGSYDPDLNLAYFGTGQTYEVSTLLNPQPRPGISTDALYTNTTLALDPDTGKLVWYYQHSPGDVWDLDWAFERTLVTLQTPAGPRKALMTVGKLGIVDALDATTGQYLWSYDLGLQNLVVAIDSKTGRKTYDPRLRLEPGQPKMVCPNASGFRNWPATAFDAATGRLYVPGTESCMDISLQRDQYGDTRMTPRRRPDADGKFGRVAALDIRARRIVWTNRRRAMQASAILATAGGLIFEGSVDHWFRALDSATGQILWQDKLEASPNSFPITYMSGDTQYVAVVVGGGSPLEASLRGLTPEIQSSTASKALWVLALRK
jgi:alcohol dehydrogenase (cytochrome c)